MIESHVIGRTIAAQRNFQLVRGPSGPNNPHPITNKKSRQKSRFLLDTSLSSSSFLANSTRHSVTSRIAPNSRLLSHLIFSTRHLNATLEKRKNVEKVNTRVRFFLSLAEKDWRPRIGCALAIVRVFAQRCDGLARVADAAQRRTLFTESPREAHSLLPQAVAEAARSLGAAATISVPLLHTLASCRPSRRRLRRPLRPRADARPRGAKSMYAVARNVAARGGSERIDHGAGSTDFVAPFVLKIFASVAGVLLEGRVISLARENLQIVFVYFHFDLAKCSVTFGVSRRISEHVLRSQLRRDFVERAFERFAIADIDHAAAGVFRHPARHARPHSRGRHEIANQQHVNHRVRALRRFDRIFHAHFAAVVFRIGQNDHTLSPGFAGEFVVTREVDRVVKVRAHRAILRNGSRSHHRPR